MQHVVTELKERKLLMEDAFNATKALTLHLPYAKP